ncbi:tryptophan synthase subunit alpha [Thermophagus xiamenensis]|uniref:Tryptophan synthase alpha chain n=1 Tax=Thermophagus xiamenensis TaxID=385682 RepID=A0A1I1UC56_9BACT|nr:tryptophan synthase subunit alpha [Thermophagus xiamenensis]SFD68446.1 tryptophan synthase, alpha chain [Thermophagus xiamenensis]
MNKLTNVFNHNSNLLSIYFTAGFPNADSTLHVLKALEQGGTDFVEVGIPYSDPLADGPVIQNSSSRALANGMSLKMLFDQLKELKNTVNIPVILMGYLNPILKFGIESFIENCRQVGVSGLIIPDLPYEIYLEKYQTLFEQNNISNIFLITPQTGEERIRKLDRASTSFLYMVSSAAVTGVRDGLSESQIQYFERIKNMQLKTPAMVGFGISNHKTYREVCRYAHGAIVGSAFIKHLETHGDDASEIIKFVKNLKNN